MKGKFDAYVLYLEPLAKRVQIWIVARSIARNFTVPIYYVFVCEAE